MIKQLSSEEYRANDALSRSDIFCMSKSPLHFHYHMEHKDDNPETAAMAFGTALHAYVLEPEKFEEEYIVVPKIDRRTKEGKALAAEIESSGKIPIDEETAAKLSEMRESVMSSPAAKLISTGKCEQSVFWTDESTKIELKCRPDIMTEVGDDLIVISDLKTTESADTEHFMRSCLMYGYDLQAAMYCIGVEAVTHKPCRFVFIAVEKNPPYACNVLEANELMIKKGTEDMRSYLSTIKKCTETGNWYGYNGENKHVNIIGLPDWLAKQYE